MEFFGYVSSVFIGLILGLPGGGGSILSIPNSLLGFAGDLMNYSMDCPFLPSISLLAMAGILVGNRLSRSMEGGKLKVAFGWLTPIMGIFILIQEIRQIS